jgi:fructoselysine-6-P-deglycase FrlB-like protein
MANRQQIQEIFGALRTTLERARRECSDVVRRVRWGEGPVYFCGQGPCSELGIAAAYAFESLLGWPVVSHPAEVFRTYGLNLLRPRSVLLIVSTSGDSLEVQELVNAAHDRGSTVVVLCNAPGGASANGADHVLVMCAEGGADTPAVAVCLYSALNFLALEGARVLKRPDPKVASLADEFDQLPGKLEWLFMQHTAVVRSAAAAVSNASRLHIIGGGFFHFPAWHLARRVRSLPAVAVDASEASEFLSTPSELAREGDTGLFLSSSQSKLRKHIHRSAARAAQNGVHVVSITDSNDYELVQASNLAVLIPLMSEAPASALTMFVLEWMMAEAQRATQKSTALI